MLDIGQERILGKDRGLKVIKDALLPLCNGAFDRLLKRNLRTFGSKRGISLGSADRDLRLYQKNSVALERKAYGIEDLAPTRCE